MAFWKAGRQLSWSLNNQKGLLSPVPHLTYPRPHSPHISHEHEPHGEPCLHLSPLGRSVLDPGTPGSRPGPEADAQLLSTPGVPAVHYTEFEDLHSANVLRVYSGQVTAQVEGQR